VQTLKKLKNELEGFGQTKWIKSTSCTAPVCTQGSQLQQWCGLLSRILPTVPFSILLLSPYWIPEGCTPTTACVKSSDASAKSFTQTSYTHAEVENICADDGDVVKNNLNFVKDVFMVCVNYIIIVIGAARKWGIKRHYFHTAPRKIPCVNTSGNIRLT
jgi:hypothetical protein